MGRKTLGILVLLVSLIVFLALAGRSLLALAWLTRGATSGDGTAREAIRVLLEINGLPIVMLGGLPIVMLGGLMIVLFLIYWRLFVRSEDDIEG
jgi:hypothetical protein